jgi:hypothetical protein
MSPTFTDGTQTLIGNYLDTLADTLKIEVDSASADALGR